MLYHSDHSKDEAGERLLGDDSLPGQGYGTLLYNGPGGQHSGRLEDTRYVQASKLAQNDLDTVWKKALLNFVNMDTGAGMSSSSASLQPQPQISRKRSTTINSNAGTILSGSTVGGRTFESVDVVLGRVKHPLLAIMSNAAPEIVEIEPNEESSVAPSQIKLRVTAFLDDRNENSWECLAEWVDGVEFEGKDRVYPNRVDCARIPHEERQNYESKIVLAHFGEV